jgi:hypothetical protein
MTDYKDNYVTNTALLSRYYMTMTVAQNNLGLSMEKASCFIMSVLLMTSMMPIKLMLIILYAKMIHCALLPWDSRNGFTSVYFEEEHATSKVLPDWHTGDKMGRK